MRKPQDVPSIGSLTTRLKRDAIAAELPVVGVSVGRVLIEADKSEIQSAFVSQGWKVRTDLARRASTTHKKITIRMCAGDFTFFEKDGIVMALRVPGSSKARYCVAVDTEHTQRAWARWISST